MTKRTKIKLILSSSFIVLPLLLASCTVSKEKQDLDLKSQVVISVPNKSEIEIDQISSKDIKLDFDMKDVQVRIESLQKLNDDTLAVKIRIISRKDPNVFVYKIESITGFKKKNNQSDVNNDSLKTDIKKQDLKEDFLKGSNPNNGEDINKGPEDNSDKEQDLKKVPKNNKYPSKDDNKQELDPKKQPDPDKDVNKHEDQKKDQNQDPAPEPKKEEQITPLSEPNNPIISPMVSGDQHSLTYDFLKANNSSQIIKETHSYKQAVERMNNFLYHGNHNQAINFRQGYDENLNQMFRQNTKDIGMFGNFGKNDAEKIAFYNESLSYDGMMKQKYLEQFN